MSARIEGRQVPVGTARLMRRAGVDTGTADATLAEQEARAHTVVLLAFDGVPAAVLALADILKPDAREAVAGLKDKGIMLLLVTGDNRLTAQAIARAAVIDVVHSEILPQDKAGIVRDLQAQGARVAMVGDDINDAPALMQADVGIAIGAGTDIAIESSDVVLTGGRVGAIGEAIEIGAVSYRKTVQNLWLAFLFNALGVPLATTGLIHPPWSMIAMALSVSAVLANSFGGRLFRTHTARTAGERVPETVLSAKDGRAEENVSFSVPTIHCQGCVDTLTGGLTMLDGVVEISGHPAGKVLDIAFNPRVTAPDAIADAIVGIGYKVEGQVPRRPVKISDAGAMMSKGRSAA